MSIKCQFNCRTSIAIIFPSFRPYSFPLWPFLFLWPGQYWVLQPFLVLFRLPWASSTVRTCSLWVIFLYWSITYSSFPWGCVRSPLPGATIIFQYSSPFQQVWQCGWTILAFTVQSCSSIFHCPQHCSTIGIWTEQFRWSTYSCCRGALLFRWRYQ